MTMKVAVYSEKYHACGASIAAARVAEALARTDARVELVCGLANPALAKGRAAPGAETRFLSDFVGNPLLKGLLAVPGRWPFKGKIQRKAEFEGFLSHLRSNRPQALNLHNHVFPDNRLLALLEICPILWTMHDWGAVFGCNSRYVGLDGVEVTQRDPRLPIRSRGFWEQVAKSRNRMVLAAPSQWLTDLARHELGELVEVICLRNIISADQMFPVDKLVARPIIGLPDDRFSLLFFAGTGAWKRKNFEILHRALELVPDIPLRIVAVGGRIEGGEATDPRVQVLGPVTDPNMVRLLYSAVDVFCLTSLFENLPNTIFEAQLCGTPALAANVGGVPEMIAEGVDGWLFDPRDAGELAAHLRRLYEQRDSLAGMREACRASVMSRFPETAGTEAYLAALRGLSEGRA
jgi:glycosyltransferase involved in cell wall biosynthesis